MRHMGILFELVCLYIKRLQDEQPLTLDGTGPREISITRESAISIIYEPPNQCERSTWYSQVSDDVRKISLHTTRDLTAHKFRKKAWMRGLGFRGTRLNTRTRVCTDKKQSSPCRIRREDRIESRNLDVSNCRETRHTNGHDSVRRLLWIRRHGTSW